MHLFIVTSKLNVFEQGAKTCGSGFCLRKFESLFFDFFCGYIVQGFHAQTQFSVFDRSDLDFYSITFGQNSCRCFDTFFADLRNVQQTGQAISKVDKCTVRFDGLYGSFGNESDLNVGNFCSAFSRRISLAERTRRLFSASALMTRTSSSLPSQSFRASSST